MPHRNSQKRYYDEDYVYFITVNTQDRCPYFREAILCELWMEELMFCKSIRAFELYTFCLNFDHFHMILKPGEGDNISKVMQYFKRYFSLDANIIMGYTQFKKQNHEGEKRLSRRLEENDLVFDKSHIETRPSGEKAFFRLQMEKNTSSEKSSRFQVGDDQEGNEKIKMRKNFEKEVLLPLQQKFHQKFPSPQDSIPKFQWQRSFIDHVIRNDQDMKNHWNYTAYNFQKHESMPENWHYTSLNYPKLIDQIE